MIPRIVIFATFLAATVSQASAQSLPPVPVLTESPWNGDWVLSQTRNTEEIKAAAAEDYRFSLQADGRIRWEIPSLHEVVEGRVDGQPMLILTEPKVGLAELQGDHQRPRGSVPALTSRCPELERTAAGWVWRPRPERSPREKRSLSGSPRPVARRRPQPTALSLAVSAEGARVLLYHVARNGKPEAEGRMTLVDQGRAWAP